MIPYFEIVECLACATGAGMSLHGWWCASRDNRQSELEGIEESLLMTSRWRLSRERERFIRQALLLFSTFLVLRWRWEHTIPDMYLPIYFTRSGVLLIISLLMLRDTVNDRLKRARIAEVVREERRRGLRRSMDRDKSA